jgi:esterase/lipase superfamily enzyme
MQFLIACAFPSVQRRKRGEMDKDQDDTSERAARYHIILLPGQNATYPSDRVAFHRDLREETMARGGGLLLFIHGFNTSFKAAIRGAAQLAFDLKTDAGSYKGAVLAYDWASYAETLRYGFLPGKGNDDRDRARASAGRLADLLRELAASFPRVSPARRKVYCLRTRLPKFGRCLLKNKPAALPALTDHVTICER